MTSIRLLRPPPPSPKEKPDLPARTAGAEFVVGETTRARTGRLGTSAALILFLAFASLAAAPQTDIKVLATGLGVGILLDATIVRAVLVPALVSLLGRWNWWFPRPVARVLRAPRPPRLAIETATSDTV